MWLTRLQVKAGKCESCSAVTYGTKLTAIPMNHTELVHIQPVLSRCPIRKNKTKCQCEDSIDS